MICSNRIKNIDINIDMDWIINSGHGIILI